MVLTVTRPAEVCTVTYIRLSEWQRCDSGDLNFYLPSPFRNFPFNSEWDPLLVKKETEKAAGCFFTFCDDDI